MQALPVHTATWLGGPQGRREQWMRGPCTEHPWKLSTHKSSGVRQLPGMQIAARSATNTYSRHSRYAVTGGQTVDVVALRRRVAGVEHTVEHMHSLPCCGGLP